MGKLPFKEFLDKLLRDIEDKGVDVTQYNLDHIAYQCSSDADYDSCKEYVDTIAILVSESIVGGRRVGVYKFKKPVVYKNRIIPAFELIAPKSGQVCPSALEHVEFVIDSDFDSFMKKYPNLQWDTSAISQRTFPMLKLKLSDYTQVKFHLQSVLEIVGDK